MLKMIVGMFVIGAVAVLGSLSIDTTVKNSRTRHTLQTFLFVISFLFSLIAIVTTYVDPDLASPETVDRLDKMVKQENPDRPKTTGQWKQQARETKNTPGDRIKRIGEQSADAVKEFGSMYPDVAKKSAAELDRNAKAN